MGIETAFGPSGQTTASGRRTTDEREEYISLNAVTKGDIVQLDSATAGSMLGYSVVKVRQPATAALKFGRFAVALEDVAAAKTGKFGRVGRFQCLTVGAAALGSSYAATNASDVLTAVAATQKVIAIALETTGGAGLAWMDFDGENGFGNEA